MSGAAWRPVIARLAGEREVWSVDLPGFGRSEALPAGEPCGIAALADAAERFFAEAGLERPHVAGNSLGGAVGLELGRRGTVASVTAISPAGFASRPGAALRGRVAAAHALGRPRLRPAAPRLVTRPGLRRLLYARCSPIPSASRPARRTTTWRRCSTAARSTTCSPSSTAIASPARSRVPATIGWGTRDGLLLPTQALRARRLLPGARHVWLRGCGHVPMSDDPDQVARLLLDGSAAPAARQNAVASASG